MISRFSTIGSLAQLNRASDYGSEGCRFESCTNHTSQPIKVGFFHACKSTTDITDKTDILLHSNIETMTRKTISENIFQ